MTDVFGSTHPVIPRAKPEGPLISSRVGPGEGENLAYKSADGRQVRAAAYRHDLDGAHDLGIDQRPHAQARHGDRVFGDEAEAQASHRHRLHPVVAVGAEHHLHLRAMLTPDAAGMVEELALQAIDVGLPVEVSDAHRVLAVEGMAGADADHEALVV